MLGIQKSSKRGRITTLRFGTNDIRDERRGSNGPWYAVRISQLDDSTTNRDHCGHKHKSDNAVKRCAKQKSNGWWTREVQSFVAMRDY